MTDYLTFDAADYLDSAESIAEFLAAVAEDANPNVQRRAIEVVQRARLALATNDGITSPSQTHPRPD
ncbi:hypothetical protein [Caballeronia sp. BR00000012568055]|uniref:hypothetical protein n=1 Tax=Caballeronia sp. BR00000012568055 TaxID=2918761 RepID=UPI0034D562DF